MRKVGRVETPYCQDPHYLLSNPQIGKMSQLHPQGKGFKPHIRFPSPWGRAPGNKSPERLALKTGKLMFGSLRGGEGALGN